MGEALFTYRRSGLSMTVYDNRIEIERGALWQPRRTQTIPLRTVTSVSVEGIAAGKLRIETSGGKEELTMGRDAERARQAIERGL